MNDFIKMMVNRRTIRRFKQEQIKSDELEQILQAGLFAPNAGGRQSAIIVVCQNAAMNDELGQLNRQTETIVNPSPGRISFEQPSILDDINIKNAFYSAPTVLTLFARKDIYNLTGDCFVAAENMVIAAQSIGIGSCIVGRSSMTFATERGREIQTAWGISDEFEARIHVVFGYPLDETPPKAKPRNDGRVIFAK